MALPIFEIRVGRSIDVPDRWWLGLSPQGTKPRAEVQRPYHERRKAAGKVLRVIDTWTTMTPAETAEMREGTR